MSRAERIIKIIESTPITREEFEDHWSDGSIYVPTAVLRDSSILTNQDWGVQKRIRGVNVGDMRVDWIKPDIAEKGILNPVALEIRKDGEVLINDGTHRLLAAEELGLEYVPVQFVPNSVDNGQGYLFCVKYGAVIRPSLGNGRRR